MGRGGGRKRVIITRKGEGEGEDEKRSKFYPQLHWEQLLN